jgi:hypothetical protein
MMIDAELAGAVVPYVAAAAGAYGASVVERVRDTAADATADATVGLGRRLLRRILGREESAEQVSDAVQDLAADPADPDRVAALRLQVRKVLAADPELAGEVAQMLERAGGTVTAAGDGAVAVNHNPGIIQTGQNSRAWQGRG